MDIQKLMAQAQQMQKNLANIEEELAETIYEGNSGGSDGVTVKINGRFEMQEVIIGTDLMNPDDREMLQDMILIAQNAAVEKAAKDKEEKLGAAAGGLKIPGM